MKRLDGRRKRKMIGVDEQTGESLRQVFVETMEEAMAALHLTAAQMSQRTGLSEATISLLLNHRRAPGLDSMARIATALRMTVAEMLSGGSR